MPAPILRGRASKEEATMTRQSAMRSMSSARRWSTIVDRAIAIAIVPWVGLAVVAATASAQTHDHSAGVQAPGPPVMQPRDLSGMLRAADESLRAVEKAVHEQVPLSVAESARYLTEVTERLGGYFEDAGARSPRDAIRTRKTLERHLRVLEQLGALVSAPSARDALIAAHDTSLRAIETIDASAAPAESDHSSHPGGRARRGGC